MSLLIGCNGGGWNNSVSNLFYGSKWDLSQKDPVGERIGSKDLAKLMPVHSRMYRYVLTEDGTKIKCHPNDSRKREDGTPLPLNCTLGNVFLNVPSCYFMLKIVGTTLYAAVSDYPVSEDFKPVSFDDITPFRACVNRTNSSKLKAACGSFLRWNGDDILRDENGYPVYTDNAASFRGGNNASANDGTYKSFLGMATTATSLAQWRGYCNNAGQNIHAGSWRSYQFIAWLHRIEFNNLNCQATYTTELDADGLPQGGTGAGVSLNGTDWNTHNGYYPFVPEGVTAPLGNNTGRLTYTIKNFMNSGTDKDVNVFSYRGLENPYEYLYLLFDDVRIWHDSPDVENPESYVYVGTDPSTFASPSSVTDKTVLPGYELLTAGVPRANGYISSMSVDSEKCMGFPTEVNVDAGASYKLCDYFYQNIGSESYGWFMLLGAGGAGDGSGAGFGYALTSNRCSYTGADCAVLLCHQKNAAS